MATESPSSPGKGPRFWARSPRVTAAALSLLVAGVALYGVERDGPGGVRVVAGESQADGASTSTTGGFGSSTGASSTTTTIGNQPVTTTLSAATSNLHNGTATTRPTTTTVHSITTTSQSSTTTTTRPVQPKLTATPALNLPERAWIEVTGSGFPASSRIFVDQCTLPPDGQLGSCGSTPRVNQNEGDFWTNEVGEVIAESRPVRRVNGTDCADPANHCVLAAFLAVGGGRDPLAVTPLAFSGPAGPELPMTVTANPTTNLVDGQSISISGENLIASTPSLTFQQCSREVGNAGVVCGNPVYTKVDDRGNVQTTMTVNAVLASQAGTVDCRVSACVIRTYFGGIPDIALSFTP